MTTNLSNHWAERGWDVTVVTQTPVSGDFYRLHRAVRRIGLNLAGSSSNGLAAVWQNLRRMLALRKVLRDRQPDVALAMMSTANILLGLASRGLSVVTVGSERTHPPSFPLVGVWDFLRRYVYRHLDAVVALTRESAAWIERNTRVRRVSIIPNAVAWPLPDQAPHVDPASVGVPGRRRLLAVGRLTREKGFDWLVDAYATLAPRYPDWELVIVGEGPERDALQACIDAAGLADRVFLVGRVGNMRTWYQASQLYVISSRFEGFPNTLAEALAHGLPAVSFDCDTGPRDIVRHDVDGLLVPPGDVAALAEGLGRLMGDAELRRQFSLRAADARERFSVERVTGLWEGLFKELQE